MGTVVNLRPVQEDGKRSHVPGRPMPTRPRCGSPPPTGGCQALVDLEARHERHVSVEVVTANASTVRQMVRDARTDVGLAAVDPAEPDTGLVETIVWADEVVVAVPTGHPWSTLEEIEPLELAETAVITRDPGANSTRIVERTLEAAGLRHAPPIAEIGCTAAARATAIWQGIPALLPLDAVRPRARRGGREPRRDALVQELPHEESELESRLRAIDRALGEIQAQLAPARPEVRATAGPFTSTEAVRAFERALAALPGVSEVTLTGYEGATQAVFDVRLS
jgi:DNA-binding transcriptional LysR family regulator